MPLQEGLLGLDSSLQFSPDPLSHLFLIIHGTGDPYIDHQPWLSSLETCVGLLQKNYDLVAHELERASRRSGPSRKMPTAMFLPVEWHRTASETWKNEVKAGDPRQSTPGNFTVRDAVAETVGDVIMLSSPFWRKSIAKHLAGQIELQFAAVKRNRPAFSGRVSLLAHSIGGMLAVELLHQELLPVDIDAIVLTGCPIPAYSALAPDSNAALATIRKFRSQVRFINLFHPLDPVAYRLEPFLRSGGEDVQPAVQIAPRKRSFWDDAGLFWDDVVYNLWSTLFPGRDSAQPETTDSSEEDNANIFVKFGGNTRGKSQVDAERGVKDKPGVLRRSSSYYMHGEEDDKSAVPQSSGGSEVLLSGRVDYELQDGMGVPPLDVMASWGAIKAHAYYWQSLDVAQMLLDIAVTSDDAMAAR